MRILSNKFKSARSESTPYRYAKYLRVYRAALKETQTLVKTKSLRIAHHTRTMVILGPNTKRELNN